MSKRSIREPAPPASSSFPLSHSQQAIWVVQQLAPDSTVYNAQFAARVRGRLDVPTLDRAVRALEQRHEVLRTTYASQGGVPVQMVHDTLDVRLEHRAVGPVADTALADMALAEIHRPYDFERGPVWRVVLFSRAEDEHLLVLMGHHILFDLVTLTTTIDELLRIYLAYERGEEPALPALTRTYRDYVAWHQEMLQGPEGADMERYWRAQLAGALPLLDVPLDHARPPVKTYEGSSHAFVLPAGNERVRAFASAHGVSPFMVLLAVYQVLLHRYTGQEDVVVGSPVPGRRSDEALHSLVGHFMNMLPLRGDLSGSPRFTDLLARVRDTVQQGRAHQEYPFSLMVQKLGLARDASHSPVFQTMFSIQRAPEEALSAFVVRMEHEVELRTYEGLVLEPFLQSQQEGLLDIYMDIAEVNGAYHAELKYDTALFDHGTVVAMGDSFCALLESALAAPEQRIGELALMTPEAQALALQAGRGAAQRRALDRTFPALFAEQAARTPDAVAVRSGPEALTYAELRRRSAHLAAYLRERGVGPDQVVGLCMERGIDLIVSAVAVLTAGGAYLALDPAHPAARTAQLLARSRARGVLATRDLLPALTTPCADLDAPVWTLAIEDVLAAPAIPALPPPPAPDHLAYVIYTSGSTGVPKGAMVEHRGMLNHLYAKIDDLGIGAGDVVAQNAPQSFVIANWQMLAGLLVGAEIHVVDRQTAADPQALLARARSGGITVLQIVPSLLRALVDHLESDVNAGGTRPPLAALRWLVPTGEALPPELARRWLAQYPHIPLLNAFGCSECSDDVAHHAIAAVTAAASSRTPIGQPVPGVCLYVVDAHMQPVPVGMPGDLWVGGVAVGRGYLGDDERTARSFARDPFARDARDARVYRTGDRVRWRPDDLLEYLGRADDQVKVRGIRVELGEIEAVLRTHATVRDAAVTADPQAPGGTRLTAHVVLHDEAAGTAEAALRAFLAQRLPAAMVPAAFLVHTSLPVNANGKLDRRALAGLATAATAARQPGQAAEAATATAQRSAHTPATPPTVPAAQPSGDAIETALAEIWSTLIGVPEVGPHDDFFALGGHSLLAVQLMVRLRERFGVVLPLNAIFDISTVARLAEVVRAQQAGAGAKPAAQAAAATPAPAAITPAPARLHEPFALTDLQQAYWLGQSELLDHGRTPAIGYIENQLTDLDVARFERAMQRLIDRHPMLRTVVQADGQQRVLREVPPFVLDFVDLRGHDARARAAIVEQTREELSTEAVPPGHWPMLRMRVHRLDQHGYLVHVGIPLLISDLQSFRIMNRDLDRLYADPDAAPPDIEIGFHDYVEALRASRQSEEHARAERYWRDRLATLPAGPGLPLARAPETIERARFRRRRGVLPTADWKALEQRARQAGLTPAAVIGAAYAEVLGAFSHTPHFAISLLYQNRPALHPQIQDVIGNFSTTILLEIDNREPIPFEQRVKTLQKRLWSDIEHAQVSGVQVVRELAHARGTNVATAVPVVLASTLHLDADVIEEGGLLGRLMSSRIQTPHIWIDHQVTQTYEGLAYHWDVLEDLFPDGLIDSMFAAYGDLLTRLAGGDAWGDAVAVRLAGAALAARTEANRTEARVSNALLHDLFTAQVRHRPDQAAVICPDRTLSYSELAARVNQLAWQLRKHGARPGQLVAIVMDKGWEQVVAALAVVTAGAAYLPIEPSLPRERLHYLIEHGQAEIILTQPALDSALDWPAAPVRIPVQAWALEGKDALPLARVQEPTDLAYVIFTSGSTGVPKGVMIDHRGAVNTILDINKRFGVGARDRGLALSSLSFDLSVYDVFGLLAAGGTIVLPDPAQARDPAHWTRLVRDHHVSVWSSVPQLMHLLVDHAEQVGAEPDAAPGAASGAAAFPDLRVVMLSGDWIPVTLPARIEAVAPAARVISLGGATEASIWSIFHVIDHVDPAWQSIPYGRPLANQRFHVLGAHLTPCPTWVTGELYIGGVGLAQGYWRDADKTRERFITHPDTGERLYRTGDLGRYLPDGSIEFLGRADFQVKVQGFRVELGEIEAQLEKHPGIAACVVTAHGPSRGEKHLVAYVVAAGEAIPADELRAHLARKLPSYMLPAVFVPLARLPLTGNGKVDRKALPSPEQVLGAGRRTDAVAPRNDIEQSLARIWREVLAVDDVGVHHDFFADLGGESFSAVRLLARVQARLGRQLPLSSLIHGPTIAQQAQALAAQGMARGTAQGIDWSPLVPLRAEGSARPLFLVHPVGGNVLCYRALVQHMRPGRPVHGLQARGFDDGQAPFARLHDMAACYLAAIRRAQPRGPYLLGGWSMGGLVALELARQLEAQGEEVALLALIDSAVPGRTAVMDDLALLAWFVRDLGGNTDWQPDPSRLPADQALAAPGSDARRAALLAQARDAGAIARDVTLAQLQRLLRVFLANNQAMEQYQPGAVRAPAVLLDAGGAQADIASRARAWAPLVARIEQHEIPGDHYSILTQPGVQRLAGLLDDHLRDRRTCSAS